MSSAPRPGRLVWERPDGTRQEFPLGTNPTLIGRGDDVDIRVNEPLVSSAHARIEWRPEGFVVLDLGSTNYTRVNGEVVAEKRLRHGDEVRFARARCVFYEDGAEQLAE